MCVEYKTQYFMQLNMVVRQTQTFHLSSFNIYILYSMQKFQFVVLSVFFIQKFVNVIEFDDFKWFQFKNIINKILDSYCFNKLSIIKVHT